MEQLQTLFRNGTEYIYDTPKKFIFASKEDVTDNFGTKALVVLIDDAGTEFSWSLTADSFKKKFTRTYKDGNIAWQGKEGDAVEVSVIKLKNGYDFFKVDEGDSEGLPADVIEGAKQAAAMKPETSAPPAAPNDSVVWDGTPRQQCWREQRATILSGILGNTSFNLNEDATILDAESLADTLTVSNRRKADELEASNPTH